jgi:DNA-binding CsgD family transcriptional regulator
MTWATESGNWLLAARIAAHIWQYWDVRGYLREGREWVNLILKQDVEYPIDLIPDLYYGFAILAGSVEDALENERVADYLIELGEQTGDRRILAMGKTIYGITRDPKRAIEGSQEAIALWRDLDNPMWVGTAQGMISRWAREIGDLDMAEEYGRSSYATLLGTGHLWAITIAMSSIGRVFQLRGEYDEAAHWYREGLMLCEQIHDNIVALRFAEFMLEITATRKEYERTVRLAAGSTRLRELISYGLRYPSEQDAIDRVLREAKRALGDERYEEIWTVGSRYSIEELIAETIAAGTPESSGSQQRTSPHPLLTRREQEVLNLVVAGMTDQQIADELYVSYRTVTTHVTNILNKLGASSRTEAAAIAVREGMASERAD